MKDISQIIPDAADFDRALVSGLQRAVGHTAIVTAQKARSEHRWQDRTYDTRNSIEPEATDMSNGARGTISANRNAERLNDGTPPHQIHPKAGEGFVGPTQPGQSRRTADDVGTHRRMLRFQIGGQTIFARSVHHPGTAPDPFLDAAADAAEEELDRGVEAAIDAALGE